LAGERGVIEFRYTYEGQTETWAHRVTSVVESPLWWRPNTVLHANMTDARANKGGRPVLCASRVHSRSSALARSVSMGISRSRQVRRSIIPLDMPP